ncbi:zinc metalloprotease HtpX [Candidatus Woesearchaeota archaeon]|nr:zinc metalloprotease HtpX [Candidatus Woesearchaeota archaeon]
MSSNVIKTFLLLGALTFLLLFFGQVLAGQIGFIFALFFVIIMNFFTYWYSDKFVLSMYRARKVSETDAPELYRVVREVSSRAKVPMPSVYIIPSDNLNAFATGRSPNHASVAATDGIIRVLSSNELQGVIAHEISHIKHRDVLIATVAATIAGVISYLATMAQWAAIFGGFGGRDDRGGQNIFGVIILAILAPFLALIIQLTLSRSREYYADESAAKLLHTGNGLASALEKLENANSSRPLRFGSEAGASLFIVNPFRGRNFVSLFSTHPKTSERIRLLRSYRF